MPLFEQTLITHTQKTICVKYLRILWSSLVEDFKVCNKFAMFTLPLATVSLIMSEAPPFEQNSIKHIYEIFVCNI